MKKENKICNFFIILALLFWNPVFFHLIYNDTTIASNKFLLSVHGLIFIIGLVLLLLNKKNRINQSINNILFSVSFLGLFIAIIISINTLKRRSNNSSTGTGSAETGFIFPKNSTFTSKTQEFTYSVRANSLGLRDREIDIDKGDSLRILCFGDSWTMGYGVEVEDSWARQLQNILNKGHSKKIQVINCGQGGAYTSIYLKHIKKIIPILKPDIILLGVLQIDDLAQLYENNPPQKNIKTRILESINYGVNSYLKNSIGDLFSKSLKKDDTKRLYMKMVNKQIKEFDYLQQKQYSLLSDIVRRLFESGNLNPGLLQYYVQFSYRDIVFNDPNHPATKLSIELMNKDINQIKKECEKYKAKLVFINMPTATFTGHHVVRNPNDILQKYFMENNKIDSIYRALANRNGIPYFELTSHFKLLEDKKRYFFKFDGHPNSKGHLEIGKNISTQLVDRELLN